MGTLCVLVLILISADATLGSCTEPKGNNLYENCKAMHNKKEGEFPANKAICKCIECSDIGIEIRCGRRNVWEVLVGKDVCMNCPKKRCLESYKPAGMRCEGSQNNELMCTSLTNCLQVELGCDSTNSHTGWQFLIHDPRKSNTLVLTNTTPNYRTLLVGRETRKLDDNMLVQHHADESFTITCVPGFGLVNNNQLVMSVKGSCNNGNIVVDPSLTCAPVCSADTEELQCPGNTLTISGQSKQCFCKLTCRPIIATCRADLKWEYDDSLCKESRFEDIPFTTEVGFVAVISYDETYNITCSKDFTELSSATASCQNGNLEMGDLQCAANCAPPPEELNCKQNIENFEHGSEGDCYCLQLCNPVHIICDNGQWKYEQSTCGKRVGTSLANTMNGEKAVVTYDFYDKERKLNSFQVYCNHPFSTQTMGSAVCVNGNVVVELKPICEAPVELETEENREITTVIIYEETSIRDVVNEESKTSIDTTVTTKARPTEIISPRKMTFCNEIPANVQCTKRTFAAGSKINCHCKENRCQSVQLTCTLTGHVDYNSKICVEQMIVTNENGVLQKYFSSGRYHFSCPKNYSLYGVHNATCKDGKPYFENKDLMPRCERSDAENQTNDEVSGQQNLEPWITGIFFAILLSILSIGVA